MQTINPLVVSVGPAAGTTPIYPTQLFLYKNHPIDGPIPLTHTHTHKMRTSTRHPPDSPPTSARRPGIAPGTRSGPACTPRG